MARAHRHHGRGPRANQTGRTPLCDLQYRGNGDGFYQFCSKRRCYEFSESELSILSPLMVQQAHSRRYSLMKATDELLGRFEYVAVAAVDDLTLAGRSFSLLRALAAIQRVAGKTSD